jgi:hypothetical protein
MRSRLVAALAHRRLVNQRGDRNRHGCATGRIAVDARTRALLSGLWRADLDDVVDDAWSRLNANSSPFS